jgi:hypothetical protein
MTPMGKQTWSRAAGAVLAAAVVALAAAGCGGAAGTGGEVPTISVQPEPTATATGSAAETSAGTTITPEASGKPTDAPSSSRAATPGGAGSPSASGDVDLTGSPSSYDDAVAQLAEARSRDVGTSGQRIFRTSEDIYCVLGDSVLHPTCELPQQAGVKDAAACGNAPSEHVGRIEIMPRGATPVCNTDTIRETVPQTVGAPAIVGRDGVECLVLDVGVTCVASGRGAAFFLGLGQYAVFAR